MPMIVSVDGFVARLLATLALVPLAACGGSSGGGGGGGNGGAFTSTLPSNFHNCVNPMQTGNLVACDGFWQHRVSDAACPMAAPGTGCTLLQDPNGPAKECSADADCTARPNGRCRVTDDGAPEYPIQYCGCEYPCVTDADCGADQLCLCSGGGGTCVSAGCRTDADCGSGFLCATATYGVDECASFDYRCQKAIDKCMTDAHCSDGDRCLYEGDHRVCGYDECGIGRPFLVGDEVRLPPVAARADWLARGVAPDVSDLDPATREALAARWAQMGSMEHASVAAFARFALQLLSLGAPADLIEDAQAAMADETRHARICFAMASAYAGAPVGPGPLDMTDALAGNDAHTILVTAIREGCVGETVAALEAAETAARAQDPVVRGILEGIAADETRHAELAYRFVRWALAAMPELAPVARAAFGEALAGAPSWVGLVAGAGAAAPSRPGSAWTLVDHGFAEGALRREIRAQALTGAVAPCAQALLAA